jgi:hypothetical protein
MKVKKLKGGALIELFIVITAILTGGIGLLILDAITCDFNVVFSGGCGSAGPSGGGGGSVTVNDPCTSAPNSCGMTNTGFLANSQSGSQLVCTASIPSDSECEPPTIAAEDFYADPTILGLNMSSTLYWNVSGSDSTECTVTGTNGLSYSGEASGSVATGNLAQTTTFTLRCQNGSGPESSASIRVIVDPRYREI